MQIAESSRTAAPAPRLVPACGQGSGRTALPLAAFMATVLVGGIVAVASASSLPTQRAAVEALALGTRALLQIASLGAVGGLLFVATVHDRRAGEATTLRRLIRAAATAGSAGSAVAVVLHAAVVTGTGVAGAADAHTVWAVLASPFGLAAALRVGGLACIVWGTRRPGQVSWVAAAGALLVLVPFALTGHGATAEPRWLVAGSTIVHAAAAGTWLGGLVGLTVVLRARRATCDATGCARLVGRFSTVAAVSLAALVPAGTVLGVAAVGSAADLLASGYGRALLVKVVLVAAVVAVGAYNRWRLVPAVTRNTPAAWARLLRTVRWEIAGLAAVFLATGLLGRLAPPA